MPKGRPRTFDAQKTLDIVMELFWRHGYEGTSLAMLADATGLNMSSLYAAFGNKESLFKKALDRYADKYGDHFRQALVQPTARLVAQTFMLGSIRQVTRPGHPHGCLTVQGALVCSRSADPVQKYLSRFRAKAQNAFRQRFQRAVDEGDLPPHTDPDQLARYLWSFTSGFAVQAAGGATRAQLQRVAQLVLHNWPPTLSQPPSPAALGR